MLWEIWGRHKASFLGQGAALAAGLCFVQWKRHGVSEILAALLALASLAGFVGGYLHLLSSFAYVEMDAAKVRVGYPARLLLKPLRTARLVLVPMLAGGLAVTAMLNVWVAFVLKPLGFLPAYDLGWISAVLLSFFWWMQALAWGLPLIRFRSLVMVAAALVHLTVGVMPQLPFGISAGWQWGILAALLVSAVALAWIGLDLMRQGTWDGPSRIPLRWRGQRLARIFHRLVGRCYVAAPYLGEREITIAPEFGTPAQHSPDEVAWHNRRTSDAGCQAIAMRWEISGYARARRSRKKFRSAFAAQFWLEWRRQGWLLPGLSGAMALLVFPLLFFVGFKWAGVDAPPPEVILGLMLIAPLLLSSVMGPAMAKFDQLDSARELPGYISNRPMTNGGLVLAKVAMALASSALTYLLVVAGAGLCQIIAGKGTLFSKAGLGTPYGPVSYLTGCAPACLLPVILTWKNLLAGIGTGLTGRPWIANVFSAWRGAASMGLIALVLAAKIHEEFREVLLHWLTGILIACLAVKIAFSTAAFIWGLRRNAITARAIGCIVGGWLVCGVFVAGCVGWVCHAINQPGLRIWVTLGGLIILPLADLAVAPLALAWNRHR